VLVATGLIVAAPAAAQTPFQTSPFAAPSPDVLIQQEQLRQQLIQQQSQIIVLESQLRTEQALRDIRAQVAPVQLSPVTPSVGPAPTIRGEDLASIPDSVLAQSNRRVREAAENRR